MASSFECPSAMRWRRRLWFGDATLQGAMMIATCLNRHRHFDAAVADLCKDT